MAAPQRQELEGPFDEVLERCLQWVLRSTPVGPDGRALADSVVSVDQVARTVGFAWADGRKCAADAQVVGFLIQEEGSFPGVSLWRWGWDDPSFAKEMTQHASELRKYGQAHKVEELQLPTMRVHKGRCWAFAALAAALSGATGTVGCPVGDKMVLLTIGPLRDG